MAEYDFLLRGIGAHEFAKNGLRPYQRAALAIYDMVVETASAGLPGVVDDKYLERIRGTVKGAGGAINKYEKGVTEYLEEKGK